MEYEMASPAGTIAYYRDNVSRAFLEGMRARQVKDLLQVTPSVLREFLAEEGAGCYTIGNKVKPRSATTVSSRQVAVGTFLTWCVKQEFIAVSPMDKVKKISRAQPDRYAFEVDEVRRLAREAKRAPGWLGARDHAIVVFLVDTGARAGGLLGLTEASFDWRRREVKLTEKGSQGRGLKTRTVPFSAQTAAAVKAYLEVRPKVAWDNLWLNNRNRPMHYGGLSMMLHNLGGYAKVDQCIAHRFRHTFAVQFYRQHKDIMALKELLGHSKVGTTQEYLRTLGLSYALERSYASPASWLT